MWWEPTIKAQVTVYHWHILTLKTFYVYPYLLRKASGIAVRYFKLKPSLFVQSRSKVVKYMPQLQLVPKEIGKSENCMERRATRVVIFSSAWRCETPMI